jgi:hypothetical protein
MRWRLDSTKKEEGRPEPPRIPSAQQWKGVASDRLRHLPASGKDSAQALECAISIGTGCSTRLSATATSVASRGNPALRCATGRNSRHFQIPGPYHGLVEARTSISESLKNLGVDRIDLYLIHRPLPRSGRYLQRHWLRCRRRACLGLSEYPTSRHSNLNEIIDATQCGSCRQSNRNESVLFIGGASGYTAASVGNRAPAALRRGASEALFLGERRRSRRIKCARCASSF